MGRVIKFRAWDGHHKEMIAPHNGDFIRWHAPSNLAAWYEVMQFTGLHDKNGREIYEGDVVRYEPDWIRITEKPRVVEFNCGGFDPFQYNGGGEYGATDCRIVGNIYENPELLGGK